MSAEAADREAVSGSRPCTPPQTSWFEFLLDPSLLEQHLQGPHPGICLDFCCQNKGAKHSVRALSCYYETCLFPALNVLFHLDLCHIT